MPTDNYLFPRLCSRYSHHSISALFSVRWITFLSETVTVQDLEMKLSLFADCFHCNEIKHYIYSLLSTYYKLNKESSLPFCRNDHSCFKGS